MYAQRLLPEIKRQLGVSATANAEDDATLTNLIDEALDFLQDFKGKTLVDEVTDPATQTLLRPLDRRFIRTYVKIEWDGTALQDALASIIENIREGK